MLDSLRKGAGTWLAKIFIALLIFSFAIWGVSGFLTGVGQNTAVKVGETEISLRDLERTYRQDVNRISQQLRRVLTPQEAAAFGLPQQALGRIVGEAALSESSRQMKLGISDERLATLIQSDPAFRGLSGSYDRTRLQQVLRDNNFTEDEYVVQRRKVAERAQLAEGLVGGMTAPLAYLEALDAYQREARAVEFFEITSNFIGEIEEPSQDKLDAYFEESKEDFRAPELRSIKFISLTPENVARPEDIAEEDALSEYERRKTNYFQEEQRKIRQLSFQSTDEANAALEKLNAGSTFEELMAERNLSNSDVALGTMTRSDFLDDVLGDTAFSLEEGAYSDVLDGQFSTVILNIQEIMPETTRPFDDVREELVKNLAAEQAEREILDLLDEIEDARAGGALLDEIGERFTFEVKTAGPFDRSQNNIDGTEVVLPDATGLVEGAFASDIGIENDVIQLGEQGFLWYEVSEVVPARLRTLDEVRSDVVEAWKADELTKRLNDTAEDIKSKLQNGTAIDAIAAETGLELKSADELTRNSSSEELGSDTIASIFSGPEGTISTSQSTDGLKRYIVRVKSTTVPAFDSSAAETAALKEQFAQQLQDSLLSQYIAGVETESGVEINSLAVNRVLGLDSQ